MANNPTGAKEVSLRKNAEYLLKANGSFKRGDAAYKVICKNYQPGFGTSCGCLPHWLLWRLGCSDTSLVNRSEVGYRYRPGQNISIIYNHPKTKKSPQVAFLPKAGDLILVDDQEWMKSHVEAKEKYLHQHVFCFVRQTQDGGKTVWETAESGHASSKAATGVVEAGPSSRQLTVANGKVWLTQEGGGMRFVFGWLSLGDLAFKDPPDQLPF